MTGEQERVGEEAASGASEASDGSRPSDASRPSDTSRATDASQTEDTTGADGGADSAPKAPLYKGEPLDAERGPGLGCFWVQVALLGTFLLLTPLTVAWQFPPWISATLLILTLVLLLFAGQTVIFLLRLVSADRKSRRVPRSATARKTVGMLEDEAQPSSDSAAVPDPRTGQDPPTPG